MTTTFSDLPRNLVEEVLSRVPVTSMRAVRFTCKKWNSLSTHESFTKKQIGQAKKKQTKDEFLVIVTMNSMAHLMSVNLQGIHKEASSESYIQRKGTLIRLNDGDRVVENQFLHCDGLLLCVTRDYSRLVVWNPYCGQTRWIEPRNSYHRSDIYTLGYEMKNKSRRSHKILRYLDAYGESVKHRICEFEIYSFDSNSWKVVEVYPDWSISDHRGGVSLKGNTYWGARDNIPIEEGEEEMEEEETPGFLICFDFKTERFGQRLPLPFHSGSEDTVTLSSVREEQLAVLCQNQATHRAEIWISNKIEPNAVSWSKLFLEFEFIMVYRAASFFVDQKNKVAVVFAQSRSRCKFAHSTAYIFGEGGYFERVDLGESHRYTFPFVCSYVPSPVQIKQSAPRGKRKRNQIIS